MLRSQSLFLRFKNAGDRRAISAKQIRLATKPRFCTTAAAAQQSADATAGGASESPATHTQVRIGSRVRGVASVSLPVAENKTVEFAVYPETSVGTLLKNIREEGEQLQEVTALTIKGERISHGTLMETLLDDKFYIQLDDKKIELLPNEAFDDTALGNLEVLTLIRQGISVAIRQRLKADPRIHMPYDEYVELCDTFGLDANEAHQLCDALHLAGDVLHYKDNPQLKATLFIRPAEVFQILNQDVFSQLVSKNQAHLQAELSQLEDQFLPLDEFKNTLDRKAVNHANLIKILGMTYLTVQFGVLARFVWIDFNWDIVEPITYFVQLATTIAGYFFFMFTQQDYTYEDLFLRLQKRRLRHLYIQSRFNWRKWNDLKNEIEELKAKMTSPHVVALSALNKARIAAEEAAKKEAKEQPEA